MNADGPESRRAECAEFERLSLADPRRAVEEGPALLSRMRAADDPAAFAYASRSLVNALPHLGRLDEAIACAATARRHARDRAPVEAARILIAAMHPRAKAGNLRGSMRAGEKAAREFAALGEDDLVARAELNLANVAKALGDPARSIELIRRVLARGERIAAIRGQALNVLGEACVQCADFDGARRAFEEALAVCEAQGFALGCAVIAGNLADTAARAGDVEGALRGFRIARERCAALGANAESCRNALEEAALLEHGGLLADARDRAEDATATADLHALAAEQARARLVAGRVLIQLEEFESAHAALAEAAERFQRLGDRHGCAQALTARARVESLRGETAAIATAHEALASLAGDAAPVERALALCEIASLEPDAASARRAGADAIAAAAAAGIPAIQAEAEAAAARAARRSGSIADAIAHARRAFLEVERVRDSLVLARTRRAFLTRRADIAAELVASLVAEGSPDALSEAFDTLDRARSLAILDAIERPRDGSSARDAKLDAHAAELRRKIDAEAGDARLVDRAARADRDAERAALDARLADARRSGSTRDSIAPSPGSAGIPAIAFFEHARRIDALVRHPDGSTTVVPIASDRSALDEAFAEFRFQVARRLRGGGQAALERMRDPGAASELRLAELALRRLRPHLAQALILPSATFVRMPLLALAVAIADAAVAVAPSLEVASLLDVAGEVRADSPSLVVSVGDARTPGIAREGAAIAARFARHGHTLHLDGDEASIARVVDALESSRRAHVACHGVFPRAAPNLAGLRLADGWFTARDAHLLRQAPAELVLSGCATGSAATHDGEEWFGLVRGFAAAGTRRIVASLWPVVDDATERLMDLVHAPGTSTPESLLYAVRSLRDSGVHPALRSAFSVFGGSKAFASA
jgi:tetratricopeptide (TPR) repeat protein